MSILFRQATKADYTATMAVISQAFNRESGSDKYERDAARFRAETIPYYVLESDGNEWADELRAFVAPVEDRRKSSPLSTSPNTAFRSVPPSSPKPMSGKSPLSPNFKDRDSGAC